MDTSLNTPKIQTSPQDFVNQNTSVFEKINNSLKEVAENAKSHLNSIVFLDNRIDNTLLENINLKLTALLGLKRIELD